MQKYIMVILILILSACTVGQNHANPSASVPTSATTQTNSSSTTQPVGGQGTKSAPTNVPALTNVPTLAAQANPRKPVGIYALVRIDEYVIQQQRANPTITPVQLDAQFDSLYQSLLSNPAISGLALQVQWNTLNPNPLSSLQPYNWSYIDDAFAQAASAKKTIQLIVTPGFSSPQWLLDQIPSCDGLFQTPVQTPPSNCGKVTFMGYGGGGGSVLPLPWNPAYKSAWQTFLTALASRYESNPTFTSIAVAGPTAASAEMILPRDGNTPNQTQFGGISPDAMWLKLLGFAYPGQADFQNSDQAFVAEWNAAIDMYGQIFSGVTLVATLDSGGFPDLGPNYAVPPSTDKLFYTGDCPDHDIVCAAVTLILSHFMDSTVGGENAKAIQTDGLTARLSSNKLGVKGVLLSQSAAQQSAPSAQILGGEQFDLPFSLYTSEEGCPLQETCTNFSPERAEYNILKVFFDGTPAASSFGAKPGSAHLNYLQVYYEDVQYATAHAGTPMKVPHTDGTSSMMSAQDLLNLASQELLYIAETNGAP